MGGMTTSYTSHPTPRQIPRRTVGLASLIGAGTVCTSWPLVWVWMIIGLSLGMPDDMGGMGAPSSVAVSVSSAVVILSAIGIVLGAIGLLRRAGALRPIAVAVVGLLVSVCLFGLLATGLANLPPASDTGLISALLVPLTGATGFALASRVTPHRATTLILALVSAATIAVVWWT